MIHASLASHRAWSGVMTRLSDALSMTAFDLPGHGQSGDWHGQGDYLDLCAGVTADCLAGPADLVGHSFGAVVALKVALERPDLCRSLTLVEPVLFAAARGSAAHDSCRAAHLDIFAALDRGDTSAAARDFTDLWGAGQPWEALSDAQKHGFADRMWMVGVTDAALDADSHGLLAPGRLEALNRPVLLIRGAESPAVMPAILETLAARLPDARSVTVPGAGHMAPLTHPVAVADAIRARHLGAPL
ncbi:alpha/beta fold hydrolase [Tranquillimonas rosea]|uniref:alpha/beta fold hydrolase n=1 Tax=Tranquillimonas rosea TaxID=641238 RepID=UPI003BAD03B6